MGARGHGRQVRATRDKIKGQACAPAYAKSFYGKPKLIVIGLTPLA